MKSFESWLYDEVESVFGIKKIKNLKILEAWILSEKKASEIDNFLLTRLKDKLVDNFISWNEDELKMQFIAPLLNIIDYNSDKYKPYSQRTLTLKTDKIEVSGKVDFMLATGKSRPKEPFFFIHEYKQMHQSQKNDPFGQLLIAMVAAQSKNDKQHPIYGTLVEGRYWYFFVLNNNEYSVSKGFDACENEIYNIYSILNKVKDYLEDILAN